MESSIEGVTNGAFSNITSSINNGNLQANSLAILGVSLGGGAPTQTDFAGTLAGMLQAGFTSPTGAGGTYTQSDLDKQYSLVCQKLALYVPNFQIPADPSSWNTNTLNSLNSAIKNQTDHLNGLNTLANNIANLEVGLADQNSAQVSQANAALMAQYTSTLSSFSNSSASTLGDLSTVKTNLQNISFENVATAVQSGQASASVTASFDQAVNYQAAPVLTAAEIDAQIKSGDIYVSSTGGFYLNRQPTNARDASVAAFVVGGNSLSSKLNNLMNDVNTRNTNVQIMNYLSSATSVSDLQTRIATEKAQYGYADVLSQVTGGALTDSNLPLGDNDVTGATGTFQSTLKTAIDNASKNQDLDTQNLQSLTTQIQSNNTAITQMIQAYEQIMKSVAQNWE
jgi:hypothetical protein